MTHHGKQPYYIFSKGIRKQAFRGNEAVMANWEGWSMQIRILTVRQANSINDRDMYNPIN